jgi:hypothetical protein
VERQLHGPPSRSDMALVTRLFLTTLILSVITLVAAFVFAQ